MQKTYKRIASGVVGVVGCLVLMVAFAACKPEPNVQPTPTGWDLVAQSLYRYSDSNGVVCYWHRSNGVLSCVRVGE